MTPILLKFSIDIMLESTEKRNIQFSGEIQKVKHSWVRERSDIDLIYTGVLNPKGRLCLNGQAVLL